MRDLFAVLRRPRFTVVWLAGFISITGDWLLNIAMPVYVYRLTGSPAASAAVVAVSVGSSLIAGVAASSLVDRWDRRRILVVANLLQVAAITPLVLFTSADRLWIVLAVAAVESTLAQFVGPAEHALVPQLVEDRHLGVANSLNAVSRNLARLLGPALGAIVATTIGLTGATLLDAASYAAAAGLVAIIGGSYRAVPDVTPAIDAGRIGGFTRWRRDLAEGLAAIRESILLRALLTTLIMTSIGEGVMSALLAVFAQRGLTGGAVDIGWLMSAQAVGGLIGGIGGAGLANRKRPVGVLVTASAALGLIGTVIFNLPRFTPALTPQIVLFALAGIPAAIAGAASMTLLQREVVDAVRGRVFAVSAVVMSFGALIGAGIAATFTDRLGVFTVLTIPGASYLLAAMVFAAMVRDRRTPRRPVDAAQVHLRREPAGAAVGVDTVGVETMARRWNV